TPRDRVRDPKIPQFWWTEAAHGRLGHEERDLKPFAVGFRRAHALLARVAALASRVGCRDGGRCASRSSDLRFTPRSGRDTRPMARGMSSNTPASQSVALAVALQSAHISAKCICCICM